MSARRYVVGWIAAMLAGVTLGVALTFTFVVAGPEKAVDKAKNTVTNTKSYEVGWDIERDTVYKATCEADRCRWQTFEYIGWVSDPGLVPYRKETQVHRGQVVELDTFGVDEVETQGFSRLERTDLPSDGDDR